MAAIRGPTTASIPGHVKVPSTKPALVKTLSRLSRTSIIDLAHKWLETVTNPALHPYLQSNRNLEEEAEEDYLYTPAKSVEELRETYQRLRNEKGTKRDIIDRILDGDWRRGISLDQLAMIDFQYLQDNDTALRWTALKLVPLADADEDASDDTSKPRKRRRISKEPAPYPEFQPATFISSLSSEICSLVKTHYYLHTTTQPSNSSLPILRLHVSDSPYMRISNADSSLSLESARTLYIALPNSCPYIYVALSGPAASAPSKDAASSTTKMDIASLKRTVLEAVPKALSRPQERWSLEPTDLTARSLRAICALRGNDRSGASGGAFSVFSEGEADSSPLDPRVEGEEEKIQTQVKTMERKRKALAERDYNVDATKVVKKAATRFGVVGVDKEGLKEDEKAQVQKPGNSKLPLAPALDRVYIRVEAGDDSVPDRPQIDFALTISGCDIFGGLRQLAELGSVNVDNMPSWMTGEEGASLITVRDGIVVNGKAGGAC